MKKIFCIISDPRVPVNISVVKVTSTSITLEWLEPTSSDSIVGYKLRKSKVKDSFLEDALSTSNTMYELGGLHPYTDYYIQVSATYENDQKDYWSKSIIVRTKTASKIFFFYIITKIRFRDFTLSVQCDDILAYQGHKIFGIRRKYLLFLSKYIFKKFAQFSH